LKNLDEMAFQQDIFPTESNFHDDPEQKGLQSLFFWFNDSREKKKKGR